MSLVYEALQKAEREKQRKTAAVEAAQTVRAEKAVVPPAKPAPVSTAAAPAPVAAPISNSHQYLTALIVCVSVVALVAIVYFAMIATRNAAAPRTVETAPAKVALTPSAPSAASAPVPASSSPVTESSSSPATAAVSPVSTANDSRFKLTGIMKMGDAYGAILNGHVVYEGQYVEGSIVKTVERDRVVLNVDGREVVIRLY